MQNILRERRRIDSILHKASKIISQIVREKNVKSVMEKLTNIRERVQYGRRMNRRLHSMPTKATDEAFRAEVERIVIKS